jgi:N-formylglutamate deformylase
MIEFLEPRRGLAPILISVPHAGTEVPGEILEAFLPERLQDLCDTDWHIHDLYDFARDLGIGLVRTRLSRWVIDMNRDPSGKSLYNDGRTITELVPTKTFTGLPLYREGMLPDQVEVDRRRTRYFDPYHQMLSVKLDALRSKFGRVLLLDAHSIIHFVPTIRRDPFPDLILGSNDEKSADADLIEAAVEILSHNGQGFSFSHNQPFKGGYITRSVGRSRPGFSALQLEMVQKNYMDESTRIMSEPSCRSIRELLFSLLIRLMGALQS